MPRRRPAACRRRRAVLITAAAVVALVAPAGGAVQSATTAEACTASNLSVVFSRVTGSAGAGHVNYALRLRNIGTDPCAVSGRPGLRLLDAKGRHLPTTVVPDHPGTAAAALVRLATNETAIADGRLSPDIPGRGEPAKGRCERRATRIRAYLASPGTGSVDGPVKPATSVCQKGRIVLGLLHRSRPTGSPPT